MLRFSRFAAALPPRARQARGPESTAVPAGQAHHHPASRDESDSTAGDPVCGVRLDPASAAERRPAGQGAYFFCSARCAAAFDADPDRYTGRTTGGPPQGGDRR
ncbi:hypothetical protein GCM10010145_67840 [Streptomyces ruber]|uniref:YHS domain-containing protein n=1 Tax=Streptomyces ruber TaxID=83378 RepID=A0A918BSU5_9ACTN|nr:hypothetical protein GCM10010145_67840 [Streptomyces ruber]